MKYLLFSIIVIGLISFIACSPKNSSKIVEQEKPKEEPKPVEIMEDKTEKTVIAVKPAFVSASIKKTACYGKCPVFELKFDATGVATYSGKKNVKKIGDWTARIGGKQYTQILEAAQKINYFNHPKTYPDNGKIIPDFPFTITSLHFGNQKHVIRNNIDAPQELIDYENYLIELGDSLEWMQIANE